MNVKKFTAATSREALRKVRDALGPDAVILSNRPVDGVVEILALDNDDVASLAA
ncbi:MAG: flagellar biosynthesis protein FlhF, partial [Massilia sp.]|nr:flagellar biosynthesis protein FlhF [Massilia sp.]